MNKFITFLGSGTCQNTCRRRPQSIAISDNSGTMLVDCGGGAYHTLGSVASDNFSPSIEFILLTHFHTDHISGLPDLLWGELYGKENRRTKPLSIYGPLGLHNFWENRLKPFCDIKELPFEINLFELNKADTFKTNNANITCYNTSHSSTSLGYKINIGNKAISITGDATISDQLQLLIDGSDHAIIEWSMTKPKQGVEHLSSEDIVSLINSTLVKNFYFVHIYKHDNTKIDEEIETRKESISTKANIYFPEDGQSFQI